MRDRVLILPVYLRRDPDALLSRLRSSSKISTRNVTAGPDHLGTRFAGRRNVVPAVYSHEKKPGFPEKPGFIMVWFFLER